MSDCSSTQSILNIDRSGVVTVLFWLLYVAGTYVSRETAAVSAHMICTPYSHAPVYSFIQNHKRHRVHVRFSRCNLPPALWQNDRDLLCATAVTRGWNGYRNKKVDPGGETSPAVPAGTRTHDLPITSASFYHPASSVSHEQLNRGHI